MNMKVYTLLTSKIDFLKFLSVVGCYIISISIQNFHQNIRPILYKWDEYIFLNGTVYYL